MLSLFHLKYILRTHILRTYIPEIILTVNIFNSCNNYNTIIIVILSLLKRKLRHRRRYVVHVVTKTMSGVARIYICTFLSPKSISDHMEHCFLWNVF